MVPHLLDHSYARLERQGFLAAATRPTSTASPRSPRSHNALSSNFSYLSVRSYFMGAYLFASHTPFDITHITPEPQVPHNLGHLNYYRAGLAYGWLDFVVLPVGLALLDDEMLALSIGINETRCYFPELGLRRLVKA